MDTTSILQSLSSKSPPLTNPLLLKPPPSTCAHLSFPCCRRRLPKVYCTNSSSTDNSSGESETPLPPLPPPVRPSETVQIRFKRGSRKRRQFQEDGFGGEGQRMKAKADPVPKKWDEMSLTEKALELYVGEKGLLFWLNKFAYASIFMVIGAWILFRFVGPALNLYQLDSAPLPPSAMFKGS